MNIEDYLHSAPKGTSKNKIEQIYQANKGDQNKIQEEINAMWSKNEENSGEDWKEIKGKASKKQKKVEPSDSGNRSHKFKNGGKDFNKKNSANNGLKPTRNSKNSSANPSLNNKDSNTKENNSLEPNKPVISDKSGMNKWKQGPPDFRQKVSNTVESAKMPENKAPTVKSDESDSHSEAKAEVKDEVKIQAPRPVGFSYADRLKGRKPVVENDAKEQVAENLNSEEVQSKTEVMEHEDNLSGENAEVTTIGDDYVHVDLEKDSAVQESQKTAQTKQMTLAELEGSLPKMPKKMAKAKIKKYRKVFKAGVQLSEEYSPIKDKTASSQVVFGDTVAENSSQIPFVTLESLVNNYDLEIVDPKDLVALKEELSRKERKIYEVENLAKSKEKEYDNLRAKLAEAEISFSKMSDQKNVKIQELEAKVLEIQTQKAQSQRLPSSRPHSHFEDEFEERFLMQPKQASKKDRDSGEISPTTNPIPTSSSGQFQMHAPPPHMSQMYQTHSNNSSQAYPQNPMQNVGMYPGQHPMYYPNVNVNVPPYFANPHGNPHQNYASFSPNPNRNFDYADQFGDSQRERSVMSDDFITQNVPPVNSSSGQNAQGQRRQNVSQNANVNDQMLMREDKNLPPGYGNYGFAGQQFPPQMYMPPQQMYQPQPQHMQFASQNQPQSSQNPRGSSGTNHGNTPPYWQGR